MAPFFDPSRLEHESIHESLVAAKSYFRGIVLDIGCGSRPYIDIVGDSAVRYLGVDLSTTHDPPPDVCADSLVLPFKDRCVETVLSTQVIEHVANPFAMMKEIGRVLRPGGCLVLTAPQAWPLHEEPFDYFRYTRYGLELLAKEAGLEIVHIRERGGSLRALAQLANAVIYDQVKQNRLARSIVKLIFPLPLSLFALLDRFLSSPKLTLGYILVARRE